MRVVRPFLADFGDKTRQRDKLLIGIPVLWFIGLGSNRKQMVLTLRFFEETQTKMWGRGATGVVTVASATPC